MQEEAHLRSEVHVYSMVTAAINRPGDVRNPGSLLHPSCTWADGPRCVRHALTCRVPSWHHHFIITTTCCHCHHCIALQVTSSRKPLNRPAYTFVFPVLEAVLGCSVHSTLHDEALAVLGLHCAPGDDIPRARSMRLLYTLLAAMPAYRCGTRVR